MNSARFQRLVWAGVVLSLGLFVWATWESTTAHRESALARDRAAAALAIERSNGQVLDGLSVVVGQLSETITGLARLQRMQAADFASQLRRNEELHACIETTLIEGLRHVEALVAGEASGPLVSPCPDELSPDAPLQPGPAPTPAPAEPPAAAGPPAGPAATPETTVPQAPPPGTTACREQHGQGRCR